MLAMLALIVALCGLAAILVGVVQFFIAACSENVAWGLGCFFLPFVSLVFLVLHWRVAKKPFLLQLGGYAAVLLASAVSGS